MLLLVIKECCENVVDAGTVVASEAGDFWLNKSEFDAWLDLKKLAIVKIYI